MYDRIERVIQIYPTIHNQTMHNLWFRTALRKSEYDTLSSVYTIRNYAYLTTFTGLHVLSLAYLAYFFRYRRLTLPATLLVSVGYYAYFELTNKITYNLLVDRKITSLARSIGQGRLAQPNGTHLDRQIEE